MAYPAPSPFDYAPLPSSGRRLMRRLLRWWPMGVVLLVGGLSILYGPRVWRHWKLMRLQEACMTAELPTDRPVYIQDYEDASILLGERPSEYARDGLGQAERVDARWAKLAAEIGVGAWPDPPVYSSATTFCHERHTPDGRRRLVIVEGDLLVTVIEPGGWLGGVPHVLSRGPARSNDNSFAALKAASAVLGFDRLHAGHADPVDRARFTVPFEEDGVAGEYEFRLEDDDQCSVRVLDPAGFVRRAQAAAATRPSS